MIGQISGVLVEKQPPEVVVDVNGIGYEIQLPMTSFYPLPDIGETLTLYTHFIVREDAQLLYGFCDKLDRALFRELIKASGVGPKLALTILSGLSAQQLLQSVQYGDISTLMSMPGIGKRTAERLVVELKDRLTKFVKQQAQPLAPLLEPDTRSTPTVALNDVREEALSALIALGYKPAQAAKMVENAYKSGMTSEAVIRDALKASL